VKWSAGVLAGPARMASDVASSGRPHQRGRLIFRMKNEEDMWSAPKIRNQLFAIVVRISSFPSSKRTNLRE
jgi:hypothetical protein